MRDDLSWNWNQKGRTVPPGQSAAALRFRAYRQKISMRDARARDQYKTSTSAAVALKRPTKGAPASSGQSGWLPLGPAPLASDATGDGMQDYNWVSGRATSVLIDSTDISGNTVLLGGAYGGLWKSTNAGSFSASTPGSVIWLPLIDDQPTLAVGAIALQPGNSNVILVGTGETNSSGDSYYGLGILRSADGGATWTDPPIQSAGTGQSFIGVGFSQIAFSTTNPNLAVAGTGGDNGLYFGLEEDGNSTARGLYFSADAGLSWNRVILSDGAVPSSATSVIYNPFQGTTGTFYAFIRRHGLYSSTDGQHFTRLATQPFSGLASANCPPALNSSGCLIYRGEFAVVPGRNEMYVWIVDVQPDTYGNPQPADEGIWQSLNGGATWTAIPDNGITNCGDDAFGLGSGCGVEQGWYNLELAAIPDETSTDVYAGAINLYKCTLIPGSTTCIQSDWINLTHVYGCNPGPLAGPAHVHPDQHGIAFMVVGNQSPGYFAHDGGISRTLDGYAGLTTGSCSGSNQFDSLSQSLGSMTEFVSFSADPSDADILLGGTQGNGSPKTSTATSSSIWQNALGGDGGFTAINSTNPKPQAREWFAENPYTVINKCEAGVACNDYSFEQVIGSNNLGGDVGAYYTPYILDPQNLTAMLVGTCRVWSVSTDGTSSIQLSNDFDTLGTGVCSGDEVNLVDAIAAGGQIANGNSSVVYAVTNGDGPLSGLPGGEVWVTTSAGVSLMQNVTQNETQNINPQGYAISTVAMDSSDATGSTAYVGIMGFSVPPNYSTSHVWKTANAGTTWTDWTGTGSAELPDNPVNVLMVDAQAGQVYAGTDVGVFVSSTSAPGWNEVGPAPGPNATGFLPNAPVTALQLFTPNASTKTLLASTYGRGIWEYALSAGFTNVILNSPLTVFPSQTAKFNGLLTPQDGYSSPVNLSCSGAFPSPCTLNPTQAIFSESSTASYTLTTGGDIGDYTFNAHAVGTDPAQITKDAPLTLHIVDFNLTKPNPDSLTVAPGGISGASIFQVTASGSFAGTVSLACTAGLPSGVTCNFSPDSANPTSSTAVKITLTVSALANTALIGPVTITISATTPGAPAAKPQTFQLTVAQAAGDFTWTDTGNTSATVLAGASATYTFQVAPMVGSAFTSAIGFACTNNPALTSCGFSPASIAVGAASTQVTLTISTTGPNPGKQAGVRTSGIVPEAWADVNAAPYAFALLVMLTIVSLGSKKRCPPYFYVAFAVIGLGVGVIVETSCGGVAGANSGGGGGTPDFSITVSPTPGTAQLNQQVTWNASLAAQNGYTEGVAVSCTANAPPTCFMTPPTVVPTAAGSAFTVTLGSDTAGTFSFAIQGTDGTKTHATPSETLTVGSITTVSPASASLFAAEVKNSWPAGVTQQQFTASQSVIWSVTGGSANGTITATGLYSTPSLVPTPATVSVVATPPSGTAGSATVTLLQPTTLGTSQITVTATAASGPAHSDSVNLTVQ